MEENKGKVREDMVDLAGVRHQPDWTPKPGVEPRLGDFLIHSDQRKSIRIPRDSDTLNTD
jgi:hypothetical protein